MEGSNGTEEYVEEELIFEKAGVRTVLIFLYSLVFILCFFGNLTVVLVVSLHWRMRTVTKFCLGNLAFANLCVGIFCVYQNLSLFLIDSWIFGLFLCKMYHFINSLSHTASVLILVVIAVERYLVIIHPFKSRTKLTFQKLRLIILAVWVTSALICSPRLYFIKTIENPLQLKEGGNEVICTLSSSIFASHTADLIHFLLLFLLPLLILTILYAKLGVFLLRRNKESRSKIPSFSRSESDPEITSHLGSDKSQGKNSQAEKYPSTSQKYSDDQIQGKNPRPRSKSINSMRIMPSFRNSQLSPKNHQKVTKSGKSFNSRNKNREFSRKSGREGNFGGSNRKNSTSQFTANLNGNSPGRNRNLRATVRIVGVVRMLITIVITFAICNLPYHLRKIYQNYVPELAYESDFTELATPLTFLLMYANCAINPILFAFLSKSFRKCMREFFQCKLRKQSTSVAGRRGTFSVRENTVA